MAAYTSTQTGLWNDSATWGGGGYPSSAGDTATIAHEVVYNLTDSSSEFYGDITINTNGHFRHLTGTHLNMNGTIYVQGGTYELVDDVTVAFTGNNSHDHGIYINNTDRTTFLANGTTNVAETRMSTSGDVGDYYIPVDDASDFQTGDWISVYFRYTDLKSREDFLNETNYPSGVLQGDGVLNTGQYGGDVFTSNTDRLHNEPARNTTEGFIIHDIDNNNLYVRDLVGPDSSITAVSTNKITVANSKVFREGQKIIFGHGSKRTVSKITAINYSTHQITLEDSLSSIDVVGESVYLGALKKHKHKRTVVRCNGHQVTSTAQADATTITLNNVSDFSVGDKFYAEHGVMEATEWDTVQQDNTSWRDELNERHEITAINGNTLTFTPALPYKVYAGYFVYKANRRITVRAATDDPSDGTCKPYIYAVNNTSTRTIGLMTRYRRKMIVKDIDFWGIGNSSSDFQFQIRGGYNDGYWRYSSTIENVVVDGAGNSEAYYIRNDYDYYRSYQNFIVANFLRAGYYAREGYGRWNCVHLNIRYGAEQWSTGDYNSMIAYCRWTRSHDYFRIYHRTVGQNYSAYQLYVEQKHNVYMHYRMYMTQCHFRMKSYLIRGGVSAEAFVHYIKLEQIGTTNDQRYFAYNDDVRLSYYPFAGRQGAVRDVDYEINNDLVMKGGIITYDNTQGAYLMKHCSGGAFQYPSGNFESTVLQPNETIRIKFSVKIHEDNANSNYSYRPHALYCLSGFSQNYVYAHRGPIYLNVTGGDETNRDFDFAGDINKKDENTMLPNQNFGAYAAYNFDSSSFDDNIITRDGFDSKDEFVERTLTITNPYSFPTVLHYGLGIVSDNANYGWYFKPYVVAREVGNGFFAKLADRLTGFIPSYFTKGTVATKQKKRIGGARL